MNNDNDSSLRWTMWFTGVVVFALMGLASASFVWERFPPLGRTPQPSALATVGESP